MHVLSYFRISSLTVYSTILKVLTAWKVLLLLVVCYDVLYCLSLVFYGYLTAS